jgi:hypothetical protein
MPLFQTKAILLIAKIIRNTFIPEPYKRNLILSFMEYFKDDNYTYDRRFYDVASNILPDHELLLHYKMKWSTDLLKYPLHKDISITLCLYNNKYVWIKTENLFDYIKDKLEQILFSVTVPYNFDFEKHNFLLLNEKEIK